MQSSKSQRAVKSAFTLVELLVVIAIIGILIGLLIPGAQMVRESARRTNCAQNQRQIAMSMHTYHNSKQRFPRIAIGNFNRPGGYDLATGRVPEPTWAWSTYLLPYLEAQNVYDILDPLHNNPADIETIAADPNRADFLQAIQTTLPIFRCPSDGAPELNSRRVFSSGLEVATSNYIGSNTAGPGPTAGDGTTDWFYMDDPDGSNNIVTGTSYGTSKTNGTNATIEGKGVFCTMRAAETIDGVRDGQSNTFAIGERAWEYGPATRRQRSWAAIAYVGRPNNEFGYQSQLGSGDMGGEAGLGMNYLWPHNSENSMDVYGSEHPAGANFAFVDGSTRFISDDINLVTFWRLTHRNDNLLLGEY